MLSVTVSRYSRARGRHKLCLAVSPAGPNLVLDQYSNRCASWQRAGTAARLLHYHVPGLNRWERAYLDQQTATVLQSGDPIVKRRSSPAALPPDLAGGHHRAWKFLESDLLTRRYCSAVVSFNLTVGIAAISNLPSLSLEFL